MKILAVFFALISGVLIGALGMSSMGIWLERDDEIISKLAKIL